MDVTSLNNQLEPHLNFIYILLGLIDSVYLPLLGFNRFNLPQFVLNQGIKKNMPH